MTCAGAIAKRGAGLIMPERIFATGDIGLWLDMSDRPTIFTNNYGGNEAPADGTVGLILDKSRALELGSELLASGATGMQGTATASAYDPGTGVGAVHKVDASNYSYVQWSGLTAGDFYRGEIENTGATTIQFNPGGAFQGFLNAGESKTLYISTFSTGSTSIRIAPASNGESASFTITSLSRIAGYPAHQSSGSSRPTLKLSGGPYSILGDGSADNLLAQNSRAAAVNSLAAKITVPASIAATQVVFGLQASASTALFLALNTSGNICGGVGSDGIATIKGSADLRGTTGVAILVADGSTVTLYWNGEEVYSAAQNGNPSTSIPFRIGALNNNGTAQDFSAANIFQALAVRRALTALEITSLSTIWR